MSPKQRTSLHGPDERIARLPTPTGIAVGDINSYVILPEPGSDELVLIDTGVRGDQAWEAMEGGLAELGYRPEDLTLILLTHAHPDHFGQAAGLARAAGCEVWAHEKAQIAIDRYAFDTSPERRERVGRYWMKLGVPEEMAFGQYGPPGGTSLVEHVVPDRTLRDGERIEVSGLTLDVVHVPGHCADLVVYWHEPSGTIFSGDHLLPDITPVCLLDIPMDDDTPRVHALAQFHESIDKVEPLRVKLLLPSHGEVLRSHRSLIAEYRLHTEERKLKIARLLVRAGGSATPFELSRTMFPKVYEAQLHLVLSELMGHLDLLVRDGNAVIEERDGVDHYVYLSHPPPR